MEPVMWRRGDSGYPVVLNDLSSPPEQLYALGNREMLEPPIISIVGTRDATSYGLRITRLLASALARAGVSIVSGMARGIDAAAHRAALEVGGRTVAVLGTGIDVPYPAGHRELHKVLSERALVVSEFGSGFTARAGAFPRRNRLIAALSPATLVIEAGERSGALNTAEWVEKLDRKLAAVPGPIDSPQSVGANDLLRTKGAELVGSVSEALAYAGVSVSLRPSEPGLDEQETRVWKALADGDLGIDALCARSNLPTRECLAAITNLEVMGMVECLLTGEVRRR